MEEYFVFDVGGHFTGEVIATTEEEGWVFDELRDISSENIMNGYPAAVEMVHYDIGIGKQFSLVEHYVWDVDAAGSNPVFPTIQAISVNGSTLDSKSKSKGSSPLWPANVSVAEWLGNGLQIRIMQVRILSDTPKKV